MYFAKTQTADRAKPQHKCHRCRGASPTLRRQGYAGQESLTPVSRSEELGRRYYSPSLCRWISRDPIGEWGGLNLYVFVDNRLLNAFDRIGLTSCSKYPKTCKPKEGTAVWASGTSFEYQGFAPIDTPLAYSGGVSSFECKWRRGASVEMTCCDAADVWCAHCGAFEVVRTASFGGGGYVYYENGILTSDQKKEVDALCAGKTPQSAFGDPVEGTQVEGWKNPPKCK